MHSSRAARNDVTGDLFVFFSQLINYLFSLKMVSPESEVCVIRPAVQNPKIMFNTEKQEKCFTGVDANR